MPLYVPDSRSFVATPADHGYKAWSMDPANVGAGTVSVSGLLYLIRIAIPVTITVSTITAYVQTAGASLTAGQNLAGLYTSGGVKIAQTGDQAAVWNSAGLKAMALTGAPFTLAGGPNAYVLAALLSNGTTPAAFRGNAVLGAHLNAGLANLTSRASSLAAQTTIPATVTTTVANGINQWVAFS